MTGRTNPHERASALVCTSPPEPCCYLFSWCMGQLFSVCGPLGFELLSHLLFPIFVCSWFSGWMGNGEP